VHFDAGIRQSVCLIIEFENHRKYLTLEWTGIELLEAAINLKKDTWNIKWANFWKVLWQVTRATNTYVVHPWCTLYWQCYVMCVYYWSQPVEDLAFNDDGSEFICAHVDGSYVVWTTNNTQHPKENPYTPYGQLRSFMFCHWWSICRRNNVCLLIRETLWGPGLTCSNTRSKCHLLYCKRFSFGRPYGDLAWLVVTLEVIVICCTAKGSHSGDLMGTWLDL